MNARQAVLRVTAVAVVLSLVLSAAVYAARPRRDRDGPSAARVELLEMVRLARKANAEALQLRREAVEGRIPDRSKPAGRDREERWIELTDAQRLARFASAQKNHTTAIRKTMEIEQYVKKHPGVALEGTPEAGLEKLQKDYAVTLVAEARFKMSKKIGTIRDWQKLVLQALKLDKDSAEAQQLDQELKGMLKEQQEDKKKESDKAKDDDKDDKTETDGKSDD